MKTRVAALLIIIGFSLMVSEIAQWWANQQQIQRDASEIVRAFELQNDSHFLDIKSSDDIDVRLAFAGKLSFVPIITSPSDAGLVMVGARSDAVCSHVAEATIYKHYSDYIEMFEWPSPGHPETVSTDLNWKGYRLLHWFQAELECWAIAPQSIEQAEFRRVTGLLRQRMGD